MSHEECGVAGDRLTRVLRNLRMDSAFCCQAELTAPWAFEMPAIADSVSFHVVVSGGCRIELPGEDAIGLRSGDVAIVPHGLGHLVADGPEGAEGRRVDLIPQEYLNDHYSVLRYGGGGRATQLVCGVVSIEDAASRELVRALPSTIVVSGDVRSTGSPIGDTVRLMAGELIHPQPGGAAVAARLADILVVQAIRAWIAGDDDAASGWLRAVRDERVGRAIEAIHADPGRAWTVERLARVATMSRSAFGARFTEVVGETPVAYLTRWRMNLARARLAGGLETVGEVADSLGYRSEASFNRAFVRVIGRTPGLVRREGERESVSPGRDVPARA